MTRIWFDNAYLQICVLPFKRISLQCFWNMEVHSCSFFLFPKFINGKNSVWLYGAIVVHKGRDITDLLSPLPDQYTILKEDPTHISRYNIKYNLDVPLSTRCIFTSSYEIGIQNGRQEVLFHNHQLSGGRHPKEAIVTPLHLLGEKHFSCLSGDDRQ